MSFSEKERERATNSQAINIQNFQGVLGDVSGGEVSQTMTLTVTPGNFESLADYFRQHNVDEHDISELEDAVSNDPEIHNAATFGPKVSAWMGKMAAKAASGTWNIGLGAAGNILATAISKFYGL